MNANNPFRKSSISSIGTLCFTLCICLLSAFTVHAQSTEQLVLNKRYTFSVQRIQPMRGNLRPEMQSPGYYSVKVTADSVISNLPFFGRSFSASIGSSESPLVFTSTKFDYTVTDRKKGGWDITIKPRDTNKVQQMTLTIFSNGNASMRVISISRDPMSFEGVVIAKR